MRAGQLGETCFRSTLIIGVNDDSMFLGVCFPFNFSSPDLLIPLLDIEVSIISTGFFGCVNLKFSHANLTELSISYRLAKKLGLVS